MARIQIPLDVFTSRMNLSDRFGNLGSQSLAQRFSGLKPISEFLDIKRLSKPANFAEMQSRINYNLSYFASNYAAVVAMICIYALIINFWLLFVILFVVGGMWFIGKLGGNDLEIGTTRITSSQLYTGLLIIAVPLGLYSSPLKTALWTIGASGTSVLGHAAVMDKPIEADFGGEAV